MHLCVTVYAIAYTAQKLFSPSAVVDCSANVLQHVTHFFQLGSASELSVENEARLFVNRLNKRVEYFGNAAV